jgi:hypothetical protein
MNERKLFHPIVAVFIIAVLYMILPGGISSLFAQQEGGRRITGIVTDENNEPLVGATIQVPGTTIGTTAGINGEYSLTLPAGSTGIQVSFIGYETQVISTDGREQINIQLQPESFTLDNLVVIGYGTQRKSDLTGSVSNVSSKDFNMGLIGSPEQLINGKVSGVQIMSNRIAYGRKHHPYPRRCITQRQ